MLSGNAGLFCLCCLLIVGEGINAKKDLFSEILFSGIDEA